MFNKEMLVFLLTIVWLCVAVLATGKGKLGIIVQNVGKIMAQVNALVSEHICL